MTDSMFALIAQEIVDSTSCFVKTRTINIMNAKGVIIASSDTERIGTLHEGALEAVKTGLTVEIPVEKVAQYKGSKEGINTPIIKDGKLLGVVGIYGNPVEIRDTARLLSVCVGLYLNQMQEMGRTAFKQSTVQNILDRMLSPVFDKNNETIQETAANIGCYPRLPAVMIVIRTIQQERIPLEALHRKLIEKKLLDEKKDLLGTNVNGYLLFKTVADCDIQFDIFLTELAQLFRLLGFDSVHIAAGKKTSSWDELYLSYKDALYLSSFNKKDIFNAENPDDAALLLLKSTSKAYLERFVKHISKILNDKDNLWRKETIYQWLICNGSFQQTASVLNIHKNTCLYRIKKVDEECGLENATIFTKMYFYSLAFQFDD